MEKNKKTLIIAGPCAIETKSQFLTTIKKIYHFCDFIRCGVWKARTSPKSYHGRGVESLLWIEHAQKKYNTPFCIEVGTLTHVKLALQHNINTFWIGARTTSNPFAIQEIAEYLNGIDAEIWIKNPIFSNLNLWFGAIERFQANKITNLKVVHRGFYSEKSIKYRNPPRWDLLQKFKLKYPEIPIISDPSHISGNKNLIQKVSQDCINKGTDGLMIEVHNQPKKALSDKQQQLNPKAFIDLLKKLNLKQSS